MQCGFGQSESEQKTSGDHLYREFKEIPGSRLFQQWNVLFQQEQAGKKSGILS